MKALFIAILTLASGLATGQMSSVPAAIAIADLPGPPKNPLIFSRMTAIMQPRLDYQDLIELKGPVATVERANIQQPSQNPDPFHAKITLKFNGQRRTVRISAQGSRGLRIGFRLPTIRLLVCST